MDRIFIGVAWPYANGPQHIGHLAGNLLPADIFARYHRLKGNEVLMVSGSDMHGSPTSFQAETEKVPPEQLAMRYHSMNREAFRQLGLSFDLYTHTHTLVHDRTVKEVFLTLLEKRLLDKRTEQSAYCKKHGRFLPDRYVSGTCPHCGNDTARGDECDECSSILEPTDLKNPVCKLCGTPASFQPSEHFYFRLPQLSLDLKAYHDTVKEHWRVSVRSFTENYLSAGLLPRPITRDLSWGVEVPLEGYDSKRIYVWFEAVIGYLSASKEWSIRQGEPERWKRFWLEGEPVRAYYFQGKDNITFHTILWPAILLALGGLKLPYDVPANEFMNVKGAKLSKSHSQRTSGVPVNLPTLLRMYEPDVIRFYVSLHIPQNHDTEFDIEEMVHERDQILADQWGNLVHRVLTFARSNHYGKVPSPRQGWTAKDSSAGSRILKVVEGVGTELEKVHIKEAFDLTLELVRDTNRAFHDAKPWASDEASKATTVYETLWAIRALTILLSPYIPFSSQKVAEMMGEPTLLSPGSWEKAREPPAAGTALGKLAPLFPKPERKDEPKATAPAGTPIDIRIGIVKEVTPHPDAERLYVLKLDTGEEKMRTLVARLRKHYLPEDLLGKPLAILANLAPRTLRGITSEGMVLAATDGDSVAVVRALEGTAPGTSLAGVEGSVRKITHEEFMKVELLVMESQDTKVGGLVVSRKEGDATTPLTLSNGGRLFPDRRIPAGARVS